MPHVLDAPVVAHDLISAGHYRLRLRCPEIANEAKAGQFCMLQVQEGLFPFLRRPMCFERIAGDEVTILYKVEGEGTRLMSRVAPGQSLSVQGPLGKPWPIDTRFARHIMVAGGIGVAPFPALAEALLAAGASELAIVLAARNKDLLLCAEDFAALGVAVYLATDDGSAGRHGFATDVLRELVPDARTRIYSCGPMPMMKAVHRVAEESGASCLQSLEAEMACGDGVCLGCVVQAKVEVEAERMVRVCYDGPVFDSALIDWAAL